MLLEKSDKIRHRVTEAYHTSLRVGTCTEGSNVTSEKSQKLQKPTVVACARGSKEQNRFLELQEKRVPTIHNAGMIILNGDIIELISTVINDNSLVLKRV